MKNLFVFKGIVLGVGLFLLWFVVYMIEKIRPASNKAVSKSLLHSLTVGNLWYWIFAFVVSVVLGCVIVKFWPR